MSCCREEEALVGTCSHLCVYLLKILKLLSEVVGGGFVLCSEKRDASRCMKNQLQNTLCYVSWSWEGWWSSVSHFDFQYHLHFFCIASYRDLGKLPEVCVFCSFFVDIKFKAFSVASSSFYVHRCESSFCYSSSNLLFGQQITQSKCFKF